MSKSFLSDSPLKTESLIRVEDLSIRFNNHQVLDHFSLEVFRGDSMVLLGRSGTGKSVALKCILNYLKPQSGRVFLYGENIADCTKQRLKEFYNRIGFVFQGGALFDSLTIKENVLFGLKLARAEGHALALSSLDKVELSSSVLNKYPNELSGGMRKRASIARTIARKPEIIFFDEPTSGLDPIGTRRINELILNLVKELNATSLTITHDLSSAQAISNRVALLNEGKVVFCDTFPQLSTSKDPFIQEFIR